MKELKNYTDIEQSKKLVEILPLESADYCWGIDDETLHYNNSPYPCTWKDYSCKEYYIPCWSLASLLGVLPQSVRLVGTPKDSYWYCECVNGNNQWYAGFGSADNPIDACYEMVLKLHELNLL